MANNIKKAIVIHYALDSAAVRPFVILPTTTTIPVADDALVFRSPGVINLVYYAFGPNCRCTQRVVRSAFLSASLSLL